MKIKNIVLDIGDVICEWNPDKLLTGIFENIDDRLQAHEDTIKHPDWLALDRGTISLDSAINNAQQRSSLNPEKIARVYLDTPASLEALTDSVAAIHEASAAGVPLYVLSNMQQHSWEHLSNEFDFWSCFQGLVISYQIKLVKPEPAIYEHLLAAHQLKASETIFIDDMPVNIEAAKQVGLQGRVLTDRAKGGELIRELIAG